MFIKKTKMTESTKLKLIATQFGANDPDVKIQENGLWFTPTFVRVGVGEYVLAIPEITHDNVNVVYSGVGGYNAGEPKAISHDVNEGGLNSNIQFFTFSLGEPSDGVMTRTAINIEIFH